MMMSVKEDGRGRRRHSGLTPAGMGGVAMMLCLCTLATAPEALAQTGSGGKLGVSVLSDPGEITEIRIPLYNSVTVQTTREVIRADVVARPVATVEVISPKRLLITGQMYGTTTVVLTGANNEQHILKVRVELDIKSLDEGLRKIDPQTTASAHSVRGHIVLTGTASSAERATRMVELATLYLPMPREPREQRVVQNNLEVAGEQQVLLRCVVAEINRAASRELGINGYLIGENFRDAFLVNQLGGINPVNIGAAASAVVTGNVPFVTGENGLVLRSTPNLSLGFPRVQMQTFIRALADNSLLKILAEPNLVAISGETATFLAGGEFPIPVPQGNQQVTIEFREFGVRLNFTPLVRGGQRIRLRVAPEVSELDFTTAVQIEGFVVPGLRTRASETTVELGSGETIAIAGLLSEQVRGIASRVPGVGDVPILGALFRSVNFQRSLTELVILVTPEIVAPLDAHQKLSLPGEDLVFPSDSELFAMGLLESDANGHGAGTSYIAGNEKNGVKVESKPDELSVHGPWGHVR